MEYLPGQAVWLRFLSRVQSAGITHKPSPNDHYFISPLSQELGYTEHLHKVFASARKFRDEVCLHLKADHDRVIREESQFKAETKVKMRRLLTKLC